MSDLNIIIVTNWREARSLLWFPKWKSIQNTIESNRFCMILTNVWHILDNANKFPNQKCHWNYVNKSFRNLPQNIYLQKCINNRIVCSFVWIIREKIVQILFICHHWFLVLKFVSNCLAIWLPLNDNHHPAVKNY